MKKQMRDKKNGARRKTEDIKKRKRQYSQRKEAAIVRRASKNKRVENNKPIDESDVKKGALFFQPLFYEMLLAGGFFRCITHFSFLHSGRHCFRDRKHPKKGQILLLAYNFWNWLARVGLFFGALVLTSSTCIFWVLRSAIKCAFTHTYASLLAQVVASHPSGGHIYTVKEKKSETFKRLKV